MEVGKNHLGALDGPLPILPAHAVRRGARIHARGGALGGRRSDPAVNGGGRESKKTAGAGMKRFRLFDVIRCAPDGAVKRKLFRDVPFTLCVDG